MAELHFFDRHDDYTVVERRLPHWIQPGVLCFITFRTHDSMPKDVLSRWRDEREGWLRQQQIDPFADNWRKQLAQLDPDLQHEFYRTFSQKWHDELDAGHGACVLRNPALARIVEDSLQHADGEKYNLTDFIIMPNHIHLLATFYDENQMLAQCESWKRWTATKINRMIDGRGRFWQQDGFDHLIRSEEQFRHYRRYISNNPTKARLQKGEFRHYSADLRVGSSLGE
ncbi:MAG: transposase [Planctomycetaceae bacterium]